MYAFSKLPPVYYSKNTEKEIDHVQIKVKTCRDRVVRSKVLDEEGGVVENVSNKESHSDVSKKKGLKRDGENAPDECKEDGSKECTVQERMKEHHVLSCVEDITGEGCEDEDGDGLPDAFTDVNVKQVISTVQPVLTNNWRVSWRIRANVRDAISTVGFVERGSTESGESLRHDFREACLATTCAGCAFIGGRWSRYHSIRFVW